MRSDRLDLVLQACRDTLGFLKQNICVYKTPGRGSMLRRPLRRRAIVKFADPPPDRLGNGRSYAPAPAGCPRGTGFHRTASRVGSQDDLAAVFATITA